MASAQIRDMHGLLFCGHGCCALLNGGYDLSDYFIRDDLSCEAPYTVHDIADIYHVLGHVGFEGAVTRKHRQTNEVFVWQAGEFAKRFDVSVVLMQGILKI